MRRKKWTVIKGNKELATMAAQELNIDPLSALLLSSRGFDDYYEMDEFFDKDAPLTLEPLTILDMDKAVERINKAIDNFELICVYGDYDADGVTATALLYSYLETHDANVVRYIPDRITEGYGLNCEAIKKLSGMGVKLIVTVDNGVSAIEEVQYAKKLNIDVVVTDHHKVGDVIPDCVAVVDPHRADCPSAFKEMSGVGVAFKLVCALNEVNEDDLLYQYSELIAIGTIGDVVSLTGENRVMVRRGISKIMNDPCAGVAALLEKAGGKNKAVTASSAAFSLCPRINASGRMSSADKALELLLTEDPDEADMLADEINSLNSQRQLKENEIYSNACELIENTPGIKNKKIIVVSGEDWHQGVIGIVAAKLTEHYGRPAIVISVSEEMAKGSCRSVEGFSIYDAILSCADCLTHFGGHTLAAGISLKPENIDEFRIRINKFADSIEMPFAEQRIDCRIQPASISLELIPAISRLEPFGAGNPQPVFGIFGVTIDDFTPVSEGKHTRILVSKNGARIATMFFGMQTAMFPFEKGNTVDLACNLEKSVYNGDERVSVYVRGIRPSVTDEEKVLRGITLYDRFSRGEVLTPDEYSLILPDRDIQVSVFRMIKTAPLRDKYIEQLCVRSGDDGSKYVRYAAAVDIMIEMGLFAVDAYNSVSVVDGAAKVNLEDSAIMKKIRSGMNI